MDPTECVKEWNDLAAEFKNLEATNREYIGKLEVIGELQAKCLKEITHQRYRMSIISSAIKSLSKSGIKSSNDERVAKLEKDMMKRSAQLHELEQTLPKKNSVYLRIILGNVNVSILNKNDKFRYKDEYEKFKLILSIIGFVLALINIVTNYRFMELILMFLLVWYYCTLTIRESILKVNGSRIKGWWRLHHFISTAVAGVLLIWPQNEPWQMFRDQFMWFNTYISVVQYLQFRYQRGVLYRLKALGARHNMDITIEGFHSWMWRGLSYLLPFLFVGYLFQLYNAYTLFHISFHPQATWQVPVLSFSFLVLFLGNMVTTLVVIPQKLSQQVPVMAVLYLVLFVGNTTTILVTLPEKWREKVKLRYRLRALAARLNQHFPRKPLGDRDDKRLDKRPLAREEDSYSEATDATDYSKLS